MEIKTMEQLTLENEELKQRVDTLEKALKKLTKDFKDFKKMEENLISDGK